MGDDGGRAASTRRTCGEGRVRRPGRLVRLVASVALLVYVYWANGIRLGPETLTGIVAPVWILVAALIVVLVNPFLGASRWRIFLRYAGVSESRPQLVKVFFLNSGLSIMAIATELI